MTDLERYLTRSDLLDCQGGVRHELTVLLDGRVRVRGAAGTVVVDPATGQVDPPGMTLPEEVFHAVADLTGHPVPVPRASRHHHGRCH